MDQWLSRLPDDVPAPDLPARINRAIAERSRARALWRRGGIAAAALGLVGVVLMAVSWPASGALPAAPDTAALLEAASSFLSAPLQALGGSAEVAVAWESSLAEGIEVAFVAGMVLLTLGSVVGLARLLRQKETLNGYPV
jgi:anti-sigma factor RsiW